MRINALLTAAKENNVEDFKISFRKQLKNASPSAYFVSFEFMKDDFQRHDNEIKSAENEIANYFYLDFFRRSEEEVKNSNKKKVIYPTMIRLRQYTEFWEIHNLKSNCQKNIRQYLLMSSRIRILFSMKYLTLFFQIILFCFI